MRAPKRGDQVTVYEDPITETVVEGRATVVTVYPGDYDSQTGTHLARVQFGAESPVIRRFKHHPETVEPRVEIIPEGQQMRGAR